jgi:hypothetical protein
LNKFQTADLQIIDTKFQRISYLTKLSLCENFEEGMKEIEAEVFNFRGIRNLKVLHFAGSPYIVLGSRNFTYSSASASPSLYATPSASIPFGRLFCSSTLQRTTK